RHGLRNVVQRAAEAAGIALDLGLEIDSYTALKELVRQGYGRTILTRAPMHADIAAGRLTAAPLVDPAPIRRLVLSFQPDRPVSRAAEFAGAAIAAILAEQLRRGVWVGEMLAG
ncbi:LysR substrate-binding domain-containing protein, partial [Methylobacterium sp. CCH5-D2]